MLGLRPSFLFPPANLNPIDGTIALRGGIPLAEVGKIVETGDPNAVRDVDVKTDLERPDDEDIGSPLARG